MSRAVRSATLLVLAILSLLAMGLVGCGGAFGRSVATLDGEWEYRPGFDPAWLTGAAPADWTPVDIPHRFTDAERGSTGPGQLTLRRRLPMETESLLRSGVPVSLNTGRVSDVSSFYVNGVLVGQLGRIDPYQSGLYRQRILDLPNLPQADRYTLTIPLYTNGTYPLHVEGPHIEVGQARDIYREHFRHEIVTLVLLGIYLVVGLYHLLLAWHRPKDLHYLYFGLFACLLAMLLFFRSSFREPLFQDLVLLRVKVEYLVLFALSAPFVLFVQHFFRLPDNNLSQGVSLLSIGLAAATLFGPYPVMRLSLTVWQIAAAVILGYQSWIVFREARRGDINARYLLGGFVVLASGVMYDALASHYLPTLISVSRFTFLVFVLSIAAVLARNFVQVYNEVEALNEGLERLVAQRAAELEAAHAAADRADRATTTPVAREESRADLRATASSDTVAPASSGTVAPASSGTPPSASSGATTSAASGTTTSAATGTTASAASGTTTSAATGTTTSAATGTTASAAIGTTTSAATGTRTTAISGTSPTASSGPTTSASADGPSPARELEPTAVLRTPPPAAPAGNDASRPAPPDASATSASPAEPPSPATIPAAKRILVADDNPLDQLIMRRFLESLGYAADFADDGKAALELALGNDYAVIFLDVHMPQLSGLEVAAALRSRALRRTPIVALTASGYVEDRQRCLDAGMDDMLSKPSTRELVADTIERLARSQEPGTAPEG